MVEVGPQPALRQHLGDAPARLAIEVFEQEGRSSRRRRTAAGCGRRTTRTGSPAGPRPIAHDGRRRSQPSPPSLAVATGQPIEHDGPDDDDGEEHRRGPRPGGERRHRAEERKVATIDAAQTPHAGPDQARAGGERQTVVEPAGEVGVPLGHEGDDRCSGEAHPAHPSGHLRRQQVGEHDANGGKGDVGEPHQQQATVGAVRRLGEPDQRGDSDVVERRMVGHPHGAVPAVTARSPLDLPLRRAVRYRRLALDLGQPEVGDLVGIAEVRLLVRVVERRLLEGEHRRDSDERDDDANEPEQRTVKPPSGRQRPGGASLARPRRSIREVSPSRRPARRC